MVRGVNQTALFVFIHLSRGWVNGSAGAGVIPADLIPAHPSGGKTNCFGTICPRTTSLALSFNSKKTCEDPGLEVGVQIIKKYLTFPPIFYQWVPLSISPDAHLLPQGLNIFKVIHPKHI